MLQVFSYTLIALAFSVVFSFICCLVWELIEYVDWKHFHNVPFDWTTISKRWIKAALILVLIWGFVFFGIWFVWVIKGIKGC